jgi:hypothetical protein
MSGGIYDVVGVGQGGHAYKFNRWTGSAWVLVLDEEQKVKPSD